MILNRESLFFQLLKYLNTDLTIDLLDNRTAEEKKELMATNDMTRTKIEKLLKSIQVTEEALQIVKTYKTQKFWKYLHDTNFSILHPILRAINTITKRNKNALPCK